MDKVEIKAILQSEYEKAIDEFADKESSFRSSPKQKERGFQGGYVADRAVENARGKCEAIRDIAREFAVELDEIDLETLIYAYEKKKGLFD